MTVIGIIFIIVLPFLYFFGSVTVNGYQARGIKRLILSIIGSSFFAIIFGLMFLGIMKLLGF